MLDRKVLKYYTSLSITPRTLAESTLFYLLLALCVVAITFIHAMHVYQFLCLHLIAFALTPMVFYASIPFFNVRRALNLAFFSFVSGLPLELLGIPLGIPGLIYTTAPLIAGLVIKGIARDSKALICIPSFFIAIETLFEIIIGINIYSLTLRIALCICSTISSKLIIRNIVNLGIKSNKDLLKIANAWTKLILANDSSELENVFYSIGFDTMVKVRGLVFDRGKDKIALIVPGVHFGPFRMLGSSALPYFIDNECSKLNFKAMVFHGAGSHELNIVRSEEARKFALEIVKALIHNNYEEIELRRPFRVFNGVREALVIPTNRTVFIAISSPVVGGDDLPLEVQTIADTIAKLYGYRSAIVVDCHNLEGRRELDPRAFESLIKAALSRDAGTCVESQVGFGEATAVGHVRGLCNNKVKVLALKCGSDIYGLVYLYGNNASIGVRESIRRLLLDKGFRDVEVFTADDHTCTGTTFDAPYYVVELSSVLLRAVEIAAQNAVADLASCKAYYLEKAIATRIVGNAIFELFELAKQAGEAVARGLKRSLMSMYGVVLLLAVLRGIHLI